MWTLARRTTVVVTLNRITPITPASKGQATQVLTILVSALVSVGNPLNRFQPMIAPTTAWLVETGKPSRVMT